MAKVFVTLTDKGDTVSMPAYTERLTGWRYWWARIRGKKTTMPDLTPIGTVVVGPDGEKWLKITL